MAERRRLCVGRLTPRGDLRIVFPHDRIGAAALAAPDLRAFGYEVTVSADPKVFDGLAEDHGARMTVRRPSR